tara:strand:+ start:10563 stop:12224 length:1662 start_codon:yes stop_codon:yes gene_type:complete
MFSKPNTQYTKSGRINIAYQVFGSGPIDLVYIPGWISNIDWMWGCPELVDFLQELGKIARVILFDKRGTGLSDRVVELSTLEERMDDIRAVMDAVGSKEAVLFGHSEGGSVSALFAATYPNRVISLITFGIFAKRRYSPDYPWAPTDEERQQVYDMIENNWGSGEMNLESLAPSKANDKTFMDWLANYFRSGASPSAAMVLTKMNTQVDIIDILGSIKVPALIMQRVNDIDVKIEEGRFIAKHIPDARFVEFEGDDHLFWVGNTQEILDEMKGFILNAKPKEGYYGKLFTIIAGRIQSSATENYSIKEIVNQYVGQFRGEIIQFNNHGFVAIFEGPSKATNCSIELVDAMSFIGIKFSVGVHVKEAAIDEAHFVSNETVQFFDSILTQALPNQVLVTQTVKNLLSGAGLSFSLYKEIFEIQSGERFSLYSASDSYSAGYYSENFMYKQLSQKGSLIERVLQVIDSHLATDSFSVGILSKEVGMSERQLQRKLKALTNKSPNQLISSVRLHRAKELILQREHNISEISYKVGFTSPSYFAKSFKREFGISPSDF